MEKLGYFSLMTLIIVLMSPHCIISKLDHRLNITSSDSSCLVGSCLTLQTLAAKTSQYTKTNSSLLLIFLPGNHTISSDLSLSDMDQLTMLPSHGSKPFVQCEGDSSGLFVLNNINVLLIQNLKFVGCTGIKINMVRKVTVFACDFLLSGAGKNSMLNITKSSAEIDTSSFRALSIVPVTEFENYGGDNHTNNSCLALAYFRNSTVVVRHSMFTDIRRNLIMNARHSSVNITNSTLNKNFGTFYFGKTTVHFINTNMTENTPTSLMILLLFNSFGYVTNGSILNNRGSVVFRYSNVAFSGMNMIHKNQVCRESNGSISNIESIITSIYSTIHIYGSTIFIENHSQMSGGAIHALGSDLNVTGSLIIFNNTADYGGGGAYFYLTDVDCYGNCNFTKNSASQTGGGLHMVSTTISLRAGWSHQQITQRKSMLIIDENEAMYGGGLYLEIDSRINVVNDGDFHYKIFFHGNKATKSGGGIFVNDKTYPGICGSASTTYYQTKTECFFQSYEGDRGITQHRRTNSIQHIHFTNNSAEIGSILYGGLLDRCSLNRVSDTIMTCGYAGHTYFTDGLSYLINQSGISSIEDIASDAVRVCFCDGNSILNCTHKPPLINVKKSEVFSVRIVAVDQVNRPVAATISVSLSAGNTVAEGQQLQNSSLSCSDLVYNVSSPNEHVNLSLYVSEGPCGNMGLSSSTVQIAFQDCTCPKGFQPSTTPNKCECHCHESIANYVSECKSGLVRRNSNSWISYDEDEGYIVFPHCPYDYCTQDVAINLSDPYGAEIQCALNHTGLLCGACQNGFSLSLGSNRCIHCSEKWKTFLALYIIAVLLGGIALVVLIFVLDLTVASGTVNALIFYANIMIANKRKFLPFAHPNFFTVVISLLNAEIGSDICFLNGLDAYKKAWLALLSPVYLIALVVVIIIVSKYSSKCAHLLGKRNPVAVLATLILLSYTSTLRNIIRTFHSATINYQNGSREVLWRVDASVKYFELKHSLLLIVALMLAVSGLLYTGLLFSWQWLLRAPSTKPFHWIRNTKLNSFMDAYIAPYNHKYRFWTGFLLLSRIVVNFCVFLNEGGDNNDNLLGVSIVIIVILLVKLYIGDSLYKKQALDCLEYTFYFNLLILTIASFYLPDGQMSQHYQQILGRISVTTTFVIFLGILAYKTHITLSKNKRYKIIKQRAKYCLTARRSYAISRHILEESSMCSIPTVSEVALSDSDDDDEDKIQDGQAIGGKIQRIANNILKVSVRRKGNLQVMTRSYDPTQLRESLLQEQN